MADADASCVFLLFFADDFRLALGETTSSLFLRFLLVEDFGASGEVDMSKSGSRNSFAAATGSFLLVFFFDLFADP
jgi:hypothetical protein